MSKVAVWISLIFTLLAPPCFGAARDAEWKKVDEAVQKGLPKSAIEALEPIIQAALKDVKPGAPATLPANQNAAMKPLQFKKPKP